MKYKSKIFDFNTIEYDKLSISQLKRQADYWLRQYLIQRESDSYYIHCPLKDINYPQDKMECAHYIDRAIMNTRYDLTNVHLVSKQSNSYDAQVQVEGYKSKHHYDYEQYLGEKIVQDLRERSKIIRIFQREDYIEVINKFRSNE
jgi:hypothetical protein